MDATTMKRTINCITFIVCLFISACGPAGGSSSTPTPRPSNTPRPTETPQPTATDTPVPYLGGDCDPGTVRVVMDTSVQMSVTGGTYPDICAIYCLWVPDGQLLEIGISNFDVDLDVFVDTDLSILEYDDRGMWRSNAYGAVDELITIQDPGGRYYVQVCSYEALPSDFTLHNSFTP